MNDASYKNYILKGVRGKSEVPLFKTNRLPWSNLGNIPHTSLAMSQDVLKKHFFFFKANTLVHQDLSTSQPWLGTMVHHLH